MGELIRISDTLFDAARTSSSETDCSIADQIEAWAKLGRAVERMLGTQSADTSSSGQPLSIDDLLATVDSDLGRQRVRQHLQTQPYPQYEPIAENPRHFVRVEEDGTRTLGRFVGMRFTPLNVPQVSDE